MAIEMIKENWDAIHEIERLTSERTGDPDARFNASCFFLGGPRRLLLSVEYRKKKKDGTFIDKMYSAKIAAAYCPFTGKPLYRETGDE